jgi:predicted amidohydrolase YtcJ
MIHVKIKMLIMPALIGLGLVAAGAAGAATPADTVYRNGTVLTMDSNRPSAGAVAVRNGEIAWVGSGKGAARFIGRKTRVVNLRGRTLMPGLIDGHAHPLAGGDILDDCDLGNLEATVAELIAVISECDAADPATDDADWLLVSNWSPVGLLPPGAEATRQDLDAAFPNRPVYIQGSDFHNAWVNSRALELAAITKDSPDPSGGSFVREPDGTPTGLLVDDAQWIVNAAVPPKKFSEMLADGRRAVRAMNASGITTATDAAAGEETLKVWAGLARKGQMTLRMNSMVLVDNGLPVSRAVAYFRRLERKYSKGRNRVPGVKMLVDGVIEYPAQTAALLEPYLVEQGGEMVPGTSKGDLYFTRERLTALVKRFDAMKKLIHMHVIGDGAARQAMNAAAAARKANGSKRRRNIALAHLQLVEPSDYARFRRLGVYADMQLQWAVSDYWVEDALRPYIGEGRYERLYPARSLISAGAPFSMGSDWPVDPLNPWAEITTAKTRSAPWAGVLDLGESISIERALRAHTMGAAGQLGLARKVGSITPGKQADMIVLDRNPARRNPGDVWKTRVLRTIVGGRTVYRLSGQSSAMLAIASSRRVGEAEHALDHGH